MTITMLFSLYYHAQTVAQVTALGIDNDALKAQNDALRKGILDTKTPPRHVRWTDGAGAGAAPEAFCGKAHQCQLPLWCDNARCVEGCIDTPFREGGGIGRVGGLCAYVPCELHWLFFEGAPELSAACKKLLRF